MRNSILLLTWFLFTFTGCASQAVKQSGQISHDLAKKVDNDVRSGQMPDVEDTGDLRDGTFATRTFLGEPDEPVDIKDKEKRKKVIKQAQADADKGWLSSVADFIDTNPVTTGIFGFLGLSSLGAAVAYGLRKINQYRGLIRDTIGVVHRLPTPVQKIFRGGMKDVLSNTQRSRMSKFVTSEKIRDLDRPSTAVLDIPGFTEPPKNS